MLKDNMKKVLMSNITKRTIFTIFLTVLVFAFSLVTSDSCVQAKKVSSNKQTNAVKNDTLSVAEKFILMDRYQEKYFTIIKKNNVLLHMEDYGELISDRRDLDNLFNEVERKITDKKYLKKYKKIQKRFSKCDDITTIGINECADKNYNAIGNLLNDVYKKAESEVKGEYSQKLAVSESVWQKNVEDYKKVYDSMGFGTIGASIYYGYEINMREFRTLLLMLFL